MQRGGLRGCGNAVIVSSPEESNGKSYAPYSSLLYDVR